MAKLHLPRFPFLAIARWFIERWLRTGMADVSPMRDVDKITVPLLLIHGEADRFVPPSDLGILHGRATTRHLQAWLVPRRDHSSVLYHRDFAPRVVDFFADAPAGEPKPIGEEPLTPPKTAADHPQGPRSIQPPAAIHRTRSLTGLL